MVCFHAPCLISPAGCGIDFDFSSAGCASGFWAAVGWCRCLRLSFAMVELYSAWRWTSWVLELRKACACRQGVVAALSWTKIGQAQWGS